MESGPEKIVIRFPVSCPRETLHSACGFPPPFCVMDAGGMIEFSSHFADMAEKTPLREGNGFLQSEIYIHRRSHHR